MKKLFLLLALCLALSGCERDTPKANVPKVIKPPVSSEEIYQFNTFYTYNASDDPIKPQISFDLGKGRYSFVYSGFSSNIPMGKFEIKDDKLYLWTDEDKTEAYTFDITDGGYMFDAQSSPAIPTYKVSGDSEERYTPVPDGALFEKQDHREKTVPVTPIKSLIKRTGDSDYKELSQEDAEALMTILGDKRETEGASDCIFDGELRLYGLTYKYSSCCGTLSRAEYSPMSHIEPQCFTITLTAEEKEAFENILTKYIQLGVDIVEAGA